MIPNFWCNNFSYTQKNMVFLKSSSGCVAFPMFSGLPGKFQGLEGRIIDQAFSLTSPDQLEHTGRTYASFIFSLVSERQNKIRPFFLSDDVC